MFLISRLEKILKSYYLLAATAGLILLGFIGSINVLYITGNEPYFLAWVGLFLTVMATMRFLAFFLAQYPKRKLAEAFVTGVFIELLVLVLISLN